MGESNPPQNIFTAAKTSSTRGHPWMAFSPSENQRPSDPTDYLLQADMYLSNLGAETVCERERATVVVVAVIALHMKIGERL